MAKPISVVIAETQSSQSSTNYGNNHTCSNACDDNNKVAGISTNTYSTQRDD